METAQPSGSIEEIEAPSYQERVFFVGANGSGKTILASEMIRAYPRVVILDVKYDFPIPWQKDDYVILSRPPGIGGAGALSWLTGDPWQSNHIVYRPRPPYDSGPWVTYWLDKMFERARKNGKKKPFVLYLDEGGWMAYSGSRLAMARVAITGRSIGIGLWIAAQRPRGIPVEVRSEAWRMYIFFLRNLDDRKEIIANVGDDVLTEYEIRATEGDYGFTEVRRREGGRMEVRRLPPVAFKQRDNPKSEKE
ncbi:MAG: hypothetical protein M1335_07005 [Chloroflexi bacterium]|nr:hypothetical protein [Chloroflexota bacterium]